MGYYTNYESNLMTTEIKVTGRVLTLSKSTLARNPNLGGEKPGATSPVHQVQVLTRPSPESDLHDQVEAHCRAKGWFYVHSRMDRRSTVSVGTPDFAIAAHGGRMLWLELKRKGGKATTAQQAAIAQLTKLGHLAFIVDNWPETLCILERL